jgi:hypothetical protein
LKRRNASKRCGPEPGSWNIFLFRNLQSATQSSSSVLDVNKYFFNWTT